MKDMSQVVKVLDSFVEKKRRFLMYAYVFLFGNIYNFFLLLSHSFFSSCTHIFFTTYIA